MKHSIVLKFVALILCALSVVAAIGGGAGIVALESSGLYVNDLDTLQDQEYNSIATTIARSYAQRYAVVNMGNLPYVLREDLYADPEERSDADHWTVQLKEGDTLLVAPDTSGRYTVVKEYDIAPLYPLVSLYGPNYEPETSDPTDSTDSTEASTPSEPSQNSPAPASAMYEELIVPEGYLYYEQDTRWNGFGFITYYTYYYQAPEYHVTVYLQEDVLESSSLHLLTDIFPLRYHFIAILTLGIILFAACLVYLCWSAGRRSDGTIHPAGLNLIPLDVYTILGGVAVWMLWDMFRDVMNWVRNEGPHFGNLSLAGVNLFAIVIIALGFLCAVSAQLKPGNAFWWRHSGIGWLLGQMTRFVRFLGRGCSGLIRLLPIMWQWVLIAFFMAVSMLVSLILSWYHTGWLVLLFAAILVCSVIVLYSAYAFGELLRGIRRMNEGDLEHKIPTKHLHGNFLSFATELNSLSETAKIAAENETRSERMRSELITNVSHDIKTPLTSIINFVDLLKKPHSPQESREYLDVLSRQSQQMKKLIEDLMELSRASSGSTPVSVTVIDAGETVNQALGEFSDKLESAHLEPVFRCPEEQISILADGRLTWRVLSNLLSNAVKYALPDTRLYVDLIRTEDAAVLSLKNISRKVLNISAQDLLERFVRGDEARNSEGSGLGLNIAKSLMELQGGTLELLMDGDLFKVTLTFPLAEG